MEQFFYFFLFPVFSIAYLLLRRGRGLAGIEFLIFVGVLTGLFEFILKVIL